MKTKVYTIDNGMTVTEKGFKEKWTIGWITGYDKEKNTVTIILRGRKTEDVYIYSISSMGHEVNSLNSEFYISKLILVLKLKIPVCPTISSKM